MKIGIIGGTRGLGKTIAILLKEELREKGEIEKEKINKWEIAITGRDQDIGKAVSQEIGVRYSNDNIKIAKESDIVIIAVPIATTSKIIKEISTFMKKGSLLIDVTSVKLEPSELMEKLVPEGVEVIPTHPVFGPRTNNLNGQVIVLTPRKKGKWYPKVMNFLKNHKMRIIESTPEEHDEMMAVVQVLTHFSYISTASAIKKLGINIKDTRNFASPIYNLMVDMISRIVSQNPFLTYSIQLENENGEKVRQIFADSVEELKTVLTDKDEEKFVEIAIEATKNMDDIQSALGRSDKAINSLNHEITILKNSIGKEIAIRHIYSGEVHIGILEELNPEFAILNTKKGQKKLKIANMEILDSDELLQWKKDNIPIKTHSISCVFPNSSNSNIIKNTVQLLDDVVNVKITDTYDGPQIEDNKVSFTFEIDSFDDSVFTNVESLLKGFGGIIR